MNGVRSGLEGLVVGAVRLAMGTAVLSLVVPTLPAGAQCSPQWFATDGVSGPTPPGASVGACAAWDPDRAGPQGQVLVVGGVFSAAGGAPAESIAVWNGTAWSALGSGIVGSVDVLAVLPNGKLVAAGLFSTAGGVAVNNIAAWNGTTWSGLGTGLNNQVWGMAVSPTTGDLYVAGMFTTAGGVTANRVARWNGSAWSSLGIGTANGVGGIAYAVTVLPNDDVIVGGSFTVAGGVSNRRHVVRWDGAAWSAMGVGTNGSVLTLATMPNGDVVAGGLFTYAGTGGPASRIARWDGIDWLPMGSGLNYQPIAMMVLESGSLVAAGHFTFAGGIPASKIAQWDGANWSAMGIGMDQYVIGLAAMPNGDVYAGGGFTTVDNMPTGYLARWSSPVAPLVTQQPVGVTTCSTGSATFTVSAVGSDPLAYQWEAELDPGVWSTLADGDLVHNSIVLGTVSGATTPSLLIDSLIHFAEDRHLLGLRCTVSNACSGATSDPATLMVCPADFNCDGFVDGIDYDTFNNYFENPDPAQQINADYNGDGFVDGIDYDLFNNDFAVGC